MIRRFTVLAFAVAALAQTGCHGRVCNFFYRLTHCCDCCPSYGYGGGAPAYHNPNYAQPCCNTPNGAMGQPVFTGMPQPMPGPNVYPTPAPPPAAGTGTEKK